MDKKIIYLCFALYSLVVSASGDDVITSGAAMDKYIQAVHRALIIQPQQQVQPDQQQMQ